jgi:hypothetical protein
MVKQSPSAFFVLFGGIRAKSAGLCASGALSFAKSRWKRDSNPAGRTNEFNGLRFYAVNLFFGVENGI